MLTLELFISAIFDQIKYRYIMAYLMEEWSAFGINILLEKDVETWTAYIVLSFFEAIDFFSDQAMHLFCSKFYLTAKI